MRTQRHITLTTPIPPSLSPGAVVASLQTVSPVMRHLGSLARYEMVPTDPAAIADDPFFAAWDPSIVAFRIHELTTLVPGLTKELQYPAYFQRVPDGLRCRANAPVGVVVWSEFKVRPRQPSTPSQFSTGSESSPSSTGTDADEYELVESAIIEADSLLMPFVARSLTNLHRDLCDKIVDEMVKNHSASPC